MKGPSQLVEAVDESAGHEFADLTTDCAGSLAVNLSADLFAQALQPLPPVVVPEGNQVEPLRL